ncbi:hypothetical protein [Flavobacterium kingsejongi]|uniref:hypothetical protein n=1 Tax=Flavobacterium kingsejongi TaxID=1678728 RepID=UPI0013004972|nr:hypothetical protein [Flavobacterium kingsejongi]
MIVLLGFGACHRKERINVLTEEDKQEICNLDTPQKRDCFLEEIVDADQGIRNKDGYYIMKYGYYSHEYNQLNNNTIQLDLLNLQKIELYLEKYGHPTNSSSEKAIYTPWLIIHHSATIEDREKNFHYLYDAYRSGILKDGYFTNFMQRFYSLKNNRSFEPKEKNNEIEELVQALGIHE